MPVAIAPVVTLSVFAIQAVARGTNSLSTAQAFTSLALITLITSPASQLISAISTCAAGLGCLTRVQKYLLASDSEGKRHNEAADTSNTHSTEKTETNSIELEKLEIVRSTDLSQYALRIQTACIRPSKDAAFQVKDLNMEIKRGNFTIIAGPVGSGKSTILKAILGELPCDSSSMTIESSRLAYCAQSPWLRNSTIQQSITELADGYAFDETWYNTVVTACSLDQDMRQFTKGDRTVIGSRGSMLSGGQKMRITLARALYARAEVLLLDDVLSALDERTANSIVEKLFHPNGLLRKLGTTIVLVTHASMRLNSFSILGFS